jgi:ABC-type sugar transport system permease subunit
LVSGLKQLLLDVPAIIIFSLFMAILLNQKMAGRGFFRAILFVPVILSTGIMAAVDAMDTNMSGAEQGIDDGSGREGGANDIISVLDVQQLFANMKVGTELVGYVVSIVNNVYQYINYSGVQMLIFLAGLQSISPSIYEASQIEGATGWEAFWKITFPVVSPFILANLIYTFITECMSTTNGVILYVSERAGSYQFSQASAMLWMYFGVMVVIIGLIYAIGSKLMVSSR